MPTIYRYLQAQVVSQRRYDSLLTRPGWYATPTAPTLTDKDSDDQAPRPSLMYNALDNGLKGDGVTNDKAAFQTLVNKLNTLYLSDGIPRGIYCPTGKYSMRDSGTVWKSGVSLFGDGPGLTKFILSNPVGTTNPTPLAAYTVSFHGASPSTALYDCTFADFEVDGSGVSLASYSTGAKALVLQYMVRATFRNLYLHGCGATALGCDFLQDSVIDSVTAVGNGRLNDGTQPGGAGIGIGIGGWGDSERLVISKCTTVGNGTHGIFVELQDGSFTPPKGIRIVNNHAEGNTHGISDWGADGLIVANNTIINNLSDGYNVSGSGVAGVAGRDGLLVTNVIDGNKVGVKLGDTATGYTGRGNRITNSATYNIQCANTTQAQSFANTAIILDQNRINNSGSEGIKVDNTLNYPSFNGNRVVHNGVALDGADSNSGGTVTYAGLTITDTSKAWSVNGHRGKTVTVGAQTAVVASNTATVLTLFPKRPNATTAWTTSTPAAGTSYSLPAPAATRAGMSFNNTVTSPTVRNNLLTDTATTKTQTHGWQITASGACTSGRVENNDLLGNLTGAAVFSTQPSGGYWSHNAGLTANAVASPSTTLLDTPVLVSGQLRYKGSVRNWVSSTLTPSATANTDGTAQIATPTSGQQGFMAIMLASVLFAGTFGSETVTATFTATYSDGTTGSAIVSTTSASRQNLAGSGLITLTKENTYITQMSVAVKSTIASSTVTATANFIATQC